MVVFITMAGDLLHEGCIVVYMFSSVGSTIVEWLSALNGYNIVMMPYLFIYNQPVDMYVNVRPRTHESSTMGDNNSTGINKKRNKQDDNLHTKGRQE